MFKAPDKCNIQHFLFFEHRNYSTRWKKYDMICYKETTQSNNAGESCEKLRLLSCLRLRADTVVEKDLHCCNNYEFYYLSTGEASALLNGKRIILQEDQFLLVPRGASVSFRSEQGLSNILEFDAEGISALDSLPENGILGRNMHVGDLCYHLSRLNAREPSLFLSKEALLAVLLEQALSVNPGKQPGLELYEQFRTYVEENLDGDLSAQAISEALSYNKDYIARTVKRFSGKSMKEYISCERLCYAKTLLADEKLGVAEVAGATGYDSVELFTKFFRYYTKISPLEYRRQLRKE